MAGSIMRVYDKKRVLDCLVDQLMEIPTEIEHGNPAISVWFVSIWLSKFKQWLRNQTKYSSIELKKVKLGWSFFLPILGKRILFFLFRLSFLTVLSFLLLGAWNWTSGLIVSGLRSREFPGRFVYWCSSNFLGESWRWSIIGSIIISYLFVSF